MPSAQVTPSFRELDPHSTNLDINLAVELIPCEIVSGPFKLIFGEELLPDQSEGRVC